MGRGRYRRYLVSRLTLSDNHQRICFTLALWNGKDHMLKERLYGLNGSQGESITR